jgi:hypothetical protein
MAEGEIVTKGRFAELSGVSAGRVSQWIAEGRIPVSAMVGEGRSARIRVDEARAALDRSLDLTQRFGANGRVRLSDDPPAPAALPLVAGLDEQIRRELLEQRKIETRRMMREEALSAGTLVASQEVAKATDRIVGRMLTAIDQAIVEMAATLAAEFTMPKRDLELALRRVWREQRGRQAEGFAAEAAAIPPETETEIDLR